MSVVAVTVTSAADRDVAPAAAVGELAVVVVVDVVPVVVSNDVGGETITMGVCSWSSSVTSHNSILQH